MPTAMDLLSTRVCDDILEVNLESRQIIIPDTVENLGVESDDSVRVLHFQVPRQYCEVDLATFTIRVNFKNTSGAGGSYDISSFSIEDNMIKFDWIVPRPVTIRRGDVKFNVCFRELLGEEVTREFNTTPATLPVLEGLETGEQIADEYADVFESLRYEMKSDIDAEAERVINKAAQDAANAVNNQLSDHVSAAQQAKDDALQAKNEARTAAGTAARDAVSAANTQLAQNVADAQAAQKAAEQARDDAQAIAGGDFLERTTYDPQGKKTDIFQYTDKAYNKVISMGEQLVVNGNGYMGDNTNFSRLTFDGTQANNSPGSFTAPRGVRNDCACDGFIPIDPTKDYILSMDAKTLNAQLMTFSFLQYYDVDGNVNSRTYSTFLPGSTTKLTQDLKRGDTVMYVEDVSGWKYENRYETAIFWNYKNSFGYAYPAETYSRNYVMLPVSGTAPVDGTFDMANNTITLRTAYTGATIPAGTAVSQGGTRWGEEYVALRGNTPPTEWKNYSGKILKTAIVPYSAFGKVGWYWNYSSHDDQMWVTNIKLESVKGGEVTSIDPNILSAPVPIAKGGTGAASAVDALANLGAVTLDTDQLITGVKRFQKDVAVDNSFLYMVNSSGHTGYNPQGFNYYRPNISTPVFTMNYNGGFVEKEGKRLTFPVKDGTLATLDDITTAVGNINTLLDEINGEVV